MLDHATFPRSKGWQNAHSKTAGAIAAVVSFALTAACTPDPADVRTTFVTPDLFQAYMGLDCQAIHQEFETVRSRLSALSTAPMLFHRRAATTPGVDRRTEISIVHGRYDALRQVSASKRCGLSGEADLLANLPTYVPPATATPSSEGEPSPHR